MKVIAVYIKEGLNPFKATDDDFVRIETHIPGNRGVGSCHEDARSATPDGYVFVDIEVPFS